MLPRLEDYMFHDRGRHVLTLCRKILCTEVHIEKIDAMAKKLKPRSVIDFPIINHNAAGIDVGATHIYVAVAPDLFPDEVRVFPTFTQDLQEAAAWLIQCQIQTVAMESTSVYWIPFFQILEDKGIEVCLVNARHVKNVPAAFKTDRRDSRWLRNLHAVGLLNASFRPDQAVCDVRTVARHRDNLTRDAARQVLHIQKSLNQMNIRLHEVISDITGVSGLAVLDAILAGERDPQQLVLLCSDRIEASSETIQKSLVGDWRAEHLFTLKQSLTTWRHFIQQINECEVEINRLLALFDPVEDPPDLPQRPKKYKPKARSGTRRSKEQERDMRDQMIQLFGIDLTLVPALGVDTVQLIFTEVGRDLSRFHSENHFASWLGLSPDNSVSGNRVLSRKTRRNSNRLARALRLAANSLTRTRCALGAYLRKMKGRLGAAKGITATAHKLARIIYTLITTRTEFDETRFAKQEERYQEKRLNRLINEAAAMGYDFVKRECVS